MEILGWIGTLLVIVAYYPQIHHLFFEKCAWGISLTTWVIWLASSILLLIYCMARGELLMGTVQVVNMAAIATTIMLVRRSDKVCPFHRKRSGGTESTSIKG